MPYPAKIVDVMRYEIPVLKHKWPNPTWVVLGSGGQQQPGTAAEAEFVILNETEVQLTEAGP